jgi:hypothetical protein
MKMRGRASKTSQVYDNLTGLEAGTPQFHFGEELDAVRENPKGR